jgi:predicted GNAT family acetyltransferase
MADGRAYINSNDKDQQIDGGVMKITEETAESGGRYIAELDGHIAEMTFSRKSPGLIAVNHTGVPEALRGKGVGQALALHAVEAARAGGWKIVPLCSFMRAQAERHPDWQDVIA